MAILEYVELFDHNGHRKEAVIYGGLKRAIECMKCNEVLSDEETHTEAQVDAISHYYSSSTPGSEGWAAVVNAFPVVTHRPCSECRQAVEDEIGAYLDGEKRLCCSCAAEVREAARLTRLAAASEDKS
jgi:hypothetical protein